MSDSKRTISTMVDSPEFKEALLLYAQSNGLPNVSTLLRVALYEYIKRRPPKETMPAVFLPLKGIL